MGWGHGLRGFAICVSVGKLFSVCSLALLIHRTAVTGTGVIKNLLNKGEESN